MKTKLMIAALSLFAVPAFAADVNCQAGTAQVGGAGSTMESAYCATADRTPNGQFVTYWDNGQKQAVGQMQNGQRVGLWTTYNRQGVKIGTVTFKADKWDGQRVKFHANGQPQTVETWAEGKMVSAQVFTAAGQPVESGTKTN